MKNVKDAGQPVISGAFFLTPRYDSFFKKFTIALRPEPFLGIPRLVQGRVLWMSGNRKGEIIELEKESAVVNIHTGELDLKVPLPETAGSERGKAGRFPIKGKLQLEAELSLPGSWRETKLPSLGVLLKKTRVKPVQVGNLQLRVTGVKKQRPLLNFPGLPDEISVDLEIKGGDISPKDVNLVDGKGKRIKSNGHFMTGRNPVQLSRTYFQNELSGDPLSHFLTIRTSSSSCSYTLKAVFRDVSFDPGAGRE
jgi:hypothetical protein